MSPYQNSYIRAAVISVAETKGLCQHDKNSEQEVIWHKADLKNEFKTYTIVSGLISHQLHLILSFPVVITFGSSEDVGCCLISHNVSDSNRVEYGLINLHCIVKIPRGKVTRPRSHSEVVFTY
jgi:hypothetical protein